MAGQTGRSGRPRKPVADLLRTDTFRRDRHGARAGDAGRAPAGPDWQPPPEALAALGTAGRALVDAMLAAYALSASEGLLVVEAGHAADAVAMWRRRAAEDGREQGAASRLYLGWSRHLAALMMALKVKL
jgi:hypothetical protein